MRVRLGRYVIHVIVHVPVRRMHRTGSAMAEQTGSQTAGLHLVVPLEQRLDLGASDAVQGELFVDEGARRPTRGYRGTVASKVAGITYRQLDYWARSRSSNHRSHHLTDRGRGDCTPSRTW